MITSGVGTVVPVNKRPAEPPAPPTLTKRASEWARDFTIALVFGLPLIFLTSYVFVPWVLTQFGISVVVP